MATAAKGEPTHVDREKLMSCYPYVGPGLRLRYSDVYLECGPTNLRRAELRGRACHSAHRVQVLYVICFGRTVFSTWYLGA